MRRKWLFILFFLPELFGTSAKAIEKSEYNVILFSLDTLAAKHLKVYGYERNTSPFLDSFAKESIFFEHAYANSGYTLASHYSIFTGTHTGTHKIIYENEKNVLDPKIPTITELLRKGGYRTAWLARSGLVNFQFKRGLNRGFDEIHDLDFDSTWAVGQLIKVITNLSGKKFFLFCHSFKLHDPYTPPEPFLKMFDPEFEGEPIEGKPLEEIRANFWGHFDLKNPEHREHLRALYDAQIRYMNIVLENFFTWLEKWPGYNKTIVIITSDHGEAFGEHNFFSHQTLHQEIQHIPLLIRIPGMSPQKTPALVQSIDILPTILELLGLPLPSGLEGKSMMPLIEGKKHAIHDQVAAKYFDMYSLQSLGSKIIKTDKGFELYDLIKDPLEKKNIFGMNQGEEKMLREKLEDYMLHSQ